MTFAALLERSRQDREAWRYTDLAAATKLFENSSHAQAAPLSALAAAALADFHDDASLNDGALDARLFFVNGAWRPDLSRLNGLPDDLLQGDPREGYRLVLAEQTCLALSPLHLFFLTAGEAAPCESETRLCVTLGANARLTLIERHDALGSLDCPAAHTLTETIVLREGAKLIHGKIVRGGPAAYRFAEADVHVAAGAYYDSFVLVGNGAMTRHEATITLEGELAQSRLLGAMLLRDGGHADITTHVTHAVPHGTSRQAVRAVLDGKARGAFKGKITVAQGAQKADAHQVSRALLLSDQAEMDAKPELEIHADDVKCGHGSAVGDLDEAMLFYLQSRGLDERAARSLLIEAFIGELADGVQTHELRDVVENEVQEWLHG